MEITKATQQIKKPLNVFINKTFCVFDIECVRIPAQNGFYGLRQKTIMVGIGYWETYNLNSFQIRIVGGDDEKEIIEDTQKIFNQFDHGIFSAKGGFDRKVLEARWFWSQDNKTPRGTELE